jgi:hypothetical protein
MSKPKGYDEITFRMGGRDWTLRFRAMKHNDGLTTFGKNIIEIDQKLIGSELRDVVVHELFEAASYELGCLYTRGYPDSRDCYHLTHTEMSQAMTMVRAAYDDLIPALGAKARDV